MGVALELKMQHRRHARPVASCEYDMDALIDNARDKCIAEFHYEDAGVSEFCFDDGSSMTVFHPVIETDDEGEKAPGSLVAQQCAQQRAEGRIGLLKSLVTFIKGRPS